MPLIDTYSREANLIYGTRVTTIVTKSALAFMAGNPILCEGILDFHFTP